MKRFSGSMIGLCVMASLLVSCSYFGSSSSHSGSGLGDQTGSMTGMPTNESTAIGGSFESKMDNIDRSKLSRALDSGLGKATSWTSGASGITYTVVPTRKVTIGNNQFCRAYSITGTRGSSSNQYTGTACLGDDSNWHPV